MSQRFSLGHLSPEHQRQVREQLNAPRETKNKYGNEPIDADGHRFASKWEAQRYRELRNLESAGLIHSLRIQVEYPLDVFGWREFRDSLKGNDGEESREQVRLGAYIADFDYIRDARHIIEDTKSVATKREKTYVWKRRHFEVQYGMRITEVERRRKRSS